MRHYSKYLLVLLLPLLLGAIPTALTGQSERIQGIKSELVSLSGEARVVKLIELAESFYDIEMYPQAAARAEEAADLAKKISYVRGRALALHWEGRALAGAEKKGFFGKSKAVPKLLFSNKIIRENGFYDSALFVANLEEMRRIALKEERTAEVGKLDQEIADVRAGNTGASGAPTAAGGTGSTATGEREALGQKLQQQLAERRGTSPQTEALQRQSAELMRQLEEKEAAISQMSESQMKTELMVMQQRQLLDSMSFRSSLDSVNIVNQQLMLTEAKTSRNFLFALAAALCLLFGGSTFSYLKSLKYNRLIQAEQQRSEELLLNILPALVAKELLKQGYTHPQFHDSVAVLFADFVGFSKIAEVLSPQVLVRELDTAFKAFDDIIQRNNLEKIKTIGDAYMCASGLELHDKDHIIRMVQAAKEMQQWLDTWNTERTKNKQPRFDARIGIHAGPVVAGVVGSKKFAFDIWGDTVNIAARVEQAGEGGKINISGTAFEHIKGRIGCQYRGAIEAKNKGKIDMYFVD